MIKIANQFCCAFSLGDVEDFIAPSNIISMRLFETAGNIRPILHLSFILEDERLIKYINQGNILRATFGIEELDKDIIEFELYGDQTDKRFSLGYEVNLQAALYKPKFTSLSISEIYPNKSSKEVIEKISKEIGLNLVTNISKANDRMDWEQLGETRWAFLKDVWLHSYINEKTFMCCGFDAYNLYFYDVRQLVLQGAKWEFTNKYIANNNSGIVNFGGYIVDNQYGATNSLVGRNIINKIYNTDTGKIEEVKYNLKNFTAIDTNNINLNSTDCLQYRYNIITEDLHDNYVKAYNQNLRNNILFSSFSIFLTTAGQFKKFKLFDTVKFNIEPRDERLNGIAFITGIVYEFENNKLNINLTLNKETPSGIKGDLLQEGS